MTKYKLKNGLQVILSPQQNTKAVSILILVKVGSRYEDDKIAGIAHFVEHMMFKGTLKRPTTLALSKELDRVGAEFNAYTNKEFTGYWIKINSEHAELAIDMLSDMIVNSKFDQKEIARESGTIIEEINMYEDEPRMSVGNLYDEVIYQKDKNLARDIIGFKKTVRAINHQKMVKFKNKHYMPNSMVMVVAGDFEPRKIKQTIQESYLSILKRKSKIDIKKFKVNQNKPQISIKYKNTEQVHLIMGFPCFGYNQDKDLMISRVLAVIMGGSMSSRLWINLRERHGLCYYIRALTDSFVDTGSFMVHAGLDKERIFSATELILKELRKIKEKGVTQEELKRAKENIKGHTVLDLEDSSSMAEWYGRQQLTVGKTQTPKQKLEEIMQITKEDVDRVAREIFQTEKINLALIGPFKDEKRFLKLLKI